MAPSPVQPMLMALIPVDESLDINLNRGAREPGPPRHGKRLVPLALRPTPAGSVECGISEPPGPCKRGRVAAMEDSGSLGRQHVGSRSGPYASRRGHNGRVAEWFKAPVLKTGVPARVPWVRIPPLPPYLVDLIIVFVLFGVSPIHSSIR